MTARSCGRALFGGALLAAVLAGPASADTPAFPDPDQSTLAGSVSEFGLSGSVSEFGLAGSVSEFGLSGSVTELSTDVTSGGRRTVSVSSDVLFAFGSATLQPEASAVLARLVTSVPPGTAVAVDGYTDAIGTPTANLALSRRRAAAVQAALAASRKDLKVTANGHGAADPVAPNTLGGKDNPAGRALNRRVTLSYQKPN